MTDRRHHPARLARRVTAGVSTAAALAMVAAMGSPATASGDATVVLPASAALGPSEVQAVVDAVPGATAGRTVLLVRRHHTAPPPGGSQVVSASGRRPAPSAVPARAAAPARSSRSGGS